MKVEIFGKRLKISVDANKTSKAQQRRIQFHLVMITGLVEFLCRPTEDLQKCAGHKALTWNLGTRDTESKGSPQVQDQLGLCSKF